MTTGQVRTLRFDSAGLAVCADVHLPAGDGPHPGVVLVEGSGPAPRHDLAPLAGVFAAAGLAALCHDKPGCGDTAGDYTGQSFGDRIAESAAALATLRAQPEVDPDRTGLWGGSQGGWIVPGVAAGDASVAFAIVCSAAAVSPFDQEAFSLEQRLRDDHRDETEIAAALAYYEHRTRRLRRGDDPADVAAEQNAVDAPWLPYVTHGEMTDAATLAFLARIGEHDPLPDWRRVTCPVLAVWGERDALVPVARSVAAYHQALRANPDVTLEVVPGADHGLRVPDPAGTGERVHAPGVLERLGAWAASRAGGARPDLATARDPAGRPARSPRGATR